MERKAASDSASRFDLDFRPRLSLRVLASEWLKLLRLLLGSML
jgi:hypothetical protein